MPNRHSIIYEVDPHNRLIVKKSGAASGVKGFREVLDGKFNIDRNNSLSYHIKRAVGSEAPQQVRFSGKYSLDNECNLLFTLNKWSQQVEGNKLIIKTGLLSAKDDKLVFSAGTRDSSGNGKVYILAFSGIWKSDKYNRLGFSLKRKKGAVDNLALEGSWRINDNNEIVCARAKTRLKTKESIKNTLIFKGRWDITKRYRIAYVLNKRIKSRFDFKVEAVRPFKSGIEYRIGIGVVPERKRLVLSGQWKLSRRFGLLFEVPHEDGAVRTFSFSAVCRFAGKKTLDFKLKNSRRRDIRMSLELSRKIAKGGGEAFIRALKEGKQVSLGAGVGFKG